MSSDGSQSFAPIRIWSPFGLGYDYPRLERWSSDNQSLYFTVGSVVDGCGVFHSGGNLQRFDVTDNTITRILFGDRWATFSPDEQQVAYFGDSGLTIRNLVTYEEQYTERTLDSQMPGGHIIWSPDGSHIAYTIANRPCFDGWAASTTAVVVDTDTMAETALLSNDERRLVTVEWLDENHILVTDSETDRYFSVDTETGRVTEADAPPRK